MPGKFQQAQIMPYDPDFSKPFIITTDASDVACEAALSQEYDGIDMPIAYFLDRLKRVKEIKRQSRRSYSLFILPLSISDHTCTDTTLK